MRPVGMCSWESKARGEGSYPPPSFPGADDFFMTAIKKSRAECSAQPVRTQDAEAGCSAAVVRCLAARPLRSITSKKTGCLRMIISRSSSASARYHLETIANRGLKK